MFTKLSKVAAVSDRGFSVKPFLGRECGAFQSDTEYREGEKFLVVHDRSYEDKNSILHLLFEKSDFERWCNSDESISLEKRDQMIKNFIEIQYFLNNPSNIFKEVIYEAIDSRSNFEPSSEYREAQARKMQETLAILSENPNVNSVQLVPISPKEPPSWGRIMKRLIDRICDFPQKHAKDK